MIKKIYIYWAQGFENAPFIVNKCLNSWKKHNKDWEIILLTDENLKNYIDIEKEIPNISKKDISKTHYSDLVRLFLLEKYGGCWCDSTTYCMLPLNKWLEKFIKSGFFAFNNPRKGIPMSNWFLYSEKNNFIIRELKNELINFWNNNEKINNYFLFHHIFRDLIKKNVNFRNVWKNTSKLSAKPCHFLLRSILNKVTLKDYIHMKKIHTPLYKLTYKYNHKKYKKNCKLYYLIKNF